MDFPAFPDGILMPSSPEVSKLREEARRVRLQIALARPTLDPRSPVWMAKQLLMSDALLLELQADRLEAENQEPPNAR